VWDPFSKVDHRPLALTGNSQGFFVASIKIESMSGSTVDEAFLAMQKAYAKAKRKMPRLYACYADAQPDERVELWLDELQVEGKIANLKCRRTTDWGLIVPKALQSSKKIQVEVARELSLRLVDGCAKPWRGHAHDHAHHKHR
jgi:hypothetical protein